MAHADEASLARLLPLLRQLRDIKGLREIKPGLFHLKNAAFIHFHAVDDTLFADLRKLGGPGFDRYPVDEPPGQRKLVDDARRRVARWLDEE